MFNGSQQDFPFFRFVSLGLELRTRVATEIDSDEFCQGPHHERILIVQRRVTEPKSQPTSFSLHRFSLSPQKAENPTSAWPPQVADHLVPNQVLGFLNSSRKERGGSFLFSKATKTLSAQIQRS
jgi:hypothetical protein